MVVSQPAKQPRLNVVKAIGLVIGPARRVQLIAAGGLGLVIMSWILFNDLRNYRTAGSQPSDMTMADVRQAAAIKPFHQRWVRLVEPVNFDCSHALQWIEGDNVTEVVLAFDASKQQPLWLEYKGGYGCETVQNIPLEGMLIKPDKFWTNKGMFVPSSQYPLMELRVGRSPADLLREAESMGAVSLVCVGMLLLGYITRPKKKPVNLLSPNAKIGP